MAFDKKALLGAIAALGGAGQPTNNLKQQEDRAIQDFIQQEQQRRSVYKPPLDPGMTPFRPSSFGPPIDPGFSPNTRQPDNFFDNYPTIIPSSKNELSGGGDDTPKNTPPVDINAVLQSLGQQVNSVSPDPNPPDSTSSVPMNNQPLQSTIDAPIQGAAGSFGRGAMSGMGAMPTSNPSMSSLDDRVNSAQNKYLNTLTETPKHAKWWKNAAIIAAEVASNVFNPQHQIPIQGWGKQKHDVEVRNALADLQPLQQLQQFKSAQAQEAAKTKEFNAKANWDQFGHPQAIKDSLQAKWDRQAQEQTNRIAAILKKHELAGEDTHIETAKDGSGQLVMVDKNGKSTLFKDPDSGEQFYNKLERPEAYQVEDGTNPDGSTKYRTVYMKGKDIASDDIRKSYNNALVGLGQGRLGETIRHNRVTEGLSAEKFATAKDQFQKTIDLRQQAQTSLDAARAKNDINAINQWELNVKNYDRMLQDMKLHLEEGFHKNELSEDQYNELNQFYK